VWCWILTSGAIEISTLGLAFLRLLLYATQQTVVANSDPIIVMVTTLTTVMIILCTELSTAKSPKGKKEEKQLK